MVLFDEKNKFSEWIHERYHWEQKLPLANMMPVVKWKKSIVSRGRLLSQSWLKFIDFSSGSPLISRCAQSFGRRPTDNALPGLGTVVGVVPDTMTSRLQFDGIHGRVRLLYVQKRFTQREETKSTAEDPFEMIEALGQRQIRYYLRQQVLCRLCYDQMSRLIRNEKFQN